MRLKNVSLIKTNFPDAHFWIIRKGSEGAVGKPVETFQKSHIGIKVSTRVFVPKYLYYVFVHIHQTGYFKTVSRGTLSLKHITVDDIKNLRIG